MSKSNLPVKREINIFTTDKKIDSVIVNEIETFLTKARKIKVQNADGFNIGISKDFEKLNIDTLMYMCEYYNFEKHSIQTTWDNEIYLTTQIRVKENIRIRLISETWKLNVLPDDVKKVIHL